MALHSHPTTAGATGAGIACGMAAGALWGLVFLAPEFAHGFTSLQLAVGRFGAYGLFAGALLAPRWRPLAAQLGRHERMTLCWLALLGNTLYYVLLASAVQRGGVAMASLVIGLLPVAVTVIGSRAQGALPLRRLGLSLLFGLAGMLSIGWQSLAGAAASPVGVLCALGALASWTAYAVGNARALARLPQVSVQDWNLATGVATGLQALVLLPFALVLDPHAHAGADWLRLAGVAVGLALLASICGNALWNRMNRLLPLTLVGQMILFETLFALLYGFAWERRLPTAAEWLAMACVVASVLSCVHAHSRPAPSRYAGAA
ncbi:MAG TPA: DMT family transporter [Pseudorhodoferax sp.]|nr:DMT family transporter [Pseudorhodoferax sp.]